jgi:phenylacetate-CoA ligase
MNPLLPLYHRLPGWARSCAATVHGYHLRSWRYGPETESLVDRALDRDRWSRTRLEVWQQERLSRLLDRAATRVPYYRRHWSERRRRGDHASWHYLENWPILEKEQVRAHPRAFLADDCDPRRMHVEHTSGTTGTPLTLWWSRKTVRAWYALAEARWRRWYGVCLDDRWANLGGQLVAPAEQAEPPYWVWNAALRQLYLSAHHVRPESAPDYARALDRHRVHYLLGYSSSLDLLARGIEASGGARPRLGLILSSAEPLFEHQRDRIAAVFGCAVYQTYGLAEIVAAASECPAGRLHLWPETGWVETLEDPSGATAPDLVCSGLLNTDMPLIRYRTGDRGVVNRHAPGCLCGRLPVFLDRIDARGADVIHTADGRELTCVDIIFEPDLAIREAQIVQESIAHLRLRYVPAAGFRPAMAEAMSIALRRRVGQVTVTLDECDHIPRGPNGKFRVIVSKVTPLKRAKASLVAV